MKIVNLRQARTNLSWLITLASKGEEVIITSRSRPMARLVFIGARTCKRQPGSLKGKLHLGPEFFEPLPKNEMSGWE